MCDSCGGEITAAIDEGKFAYLFGRASGRQHNMARANQNAFQMKRLGVTDDETERSVLRHHFHAVVNEASNVVRRFTTPYGTFEIRESLCAGPSGKLAQFTSTWELLFDGTRRLTTVIPKGGSL